MRSTLGIHHRPHSDYAVGWTSVSSRPGRGKILTVSAKYPVQTEPVPMHCPIPWVSERFVTELTLNIPIFRSAIPVVYLTTNWTNSYRMTVKTQLCLCNIQGVGVYTNVSANYMFRPFPVRPSSGWT